MESEPEQTELAEGEVLVVYRIVRTADSESPEFAGSFKSSWELGLPPRGRERTYPLIRRGVSVWETQEAAIRTALSYPQIGHYVAELRLTRETGATYYRWEKPSGHLTIWGDALNLASSAVDTICVDKGSENKSGLPNTG